MDRILATWVDGNRLIRAEHFFWILGGHIQKTSEGLLRHLLHCALSCLHARESSEDHEFIKCVLGTNRMSGNVNRAWAYDELCEMLVKLVSCSDTKFFFLVDALDESEPQDRLSELAEEVLRISQLPNVKLCVSCRPWSCFTSKFSQAQTLHLDKLTLQDMKLCISNRLAYACASNDICSDFQACVQGTRATEFITKVAIAAEGVFLWTELVVKALSSEIRKGCGFTQLERMLGDFPLGLDEYFHSLVFDRINKTRQNILDTSTALMLALKIEEHYERHNRHMPYPKSFLNFWLLKSGRLKRGFSWTDHGDKWYAPEDVKQMVVQTRDFLEETCKGLLVVVATGRASEYDDISTFRCNIEFLHRTVVDFLQDNPLRLCIDQNSPDHFNEDDFIVNLGKLRSIFLFREMDMSCFTSEIHFSNALEWSAVSSSDDNVWISGCESLLITRFQRSCKCLGYEHFSFSHQSTYPYARSGLVDYMFTLMQTWPNTASGWGPRGVLAEFLRGWLTLLLEESQEEPNDQIEGSSFPSPTWSQSRIVMQQNVSSGMPELGSVILRNAFTFRLRDSRMRLLDGLLGCGVNMNQKDRAEDWMTNSPFAAKWDRCGSMWQNWLRLVYLKLDSESGKCQQLPRFDKSTDKVKRKITDIVLVFLKHGADPTCTICISPYHEGMACRLMPIQTVLGRIVSYDITVEGQMSRAVRSFHPRTTRRDCMLKAMRSWMGTASKECANGVGTSGMPEHLVIDFVSDFIGNAFGGSCSSCMDSPVSNEPASVFAACLDCLGKYQLCQMCAERNHHGFPDPTSLSKHVVHEFMPTYHNHMQIAFGTRTGAWMPTMHFGAMETIRALEDWYSRNIDDIHGID